MFFTEEKNAIYKLIEASLEECHYCKKVIKKHFKKNLVMFLEDERRFKPSNKCWTCNKLFIEEDKNVRNHDHLTAKYRGSGHSDCNINLKLTKKVHAIFHNLRGYDSHSIMQEIDKFVAKISVIPNGLQ